MVRVLLGEASLVLSAWGPLLPWTHWKVVVCRGRGAAAEGSTSLPALYPIGTGTLWSQGMDLNIIIGFTRGGGWNDAERGSDEEGQGKQRERVKIDRAGRRERKLPSRSSVCPVLHSMPAAGSVIYD